MAAGPPAVESAARAPISSSTSPRRRSTWARTRSARRCSRRGRGTTAARSSSATPSAARTSSSSTATRSCSIARERRGESAGVRGGAARGRPRRDSPSARWRRRSASSTRCGSRSARPSRLRREERVRRRRRRHLGRHRLGAHGRARRRGAGPGRVHCVSMPSRFHLGGDEGRRAARRRVDRRRLPRDPRSTRSSAPRGALAASFAGRERDARGGEPPGAGAGTLLMALSNKLGWLVLATGNKSELSVGYATLYGDMAGGFALLKDVYKTDVWRLSRHLNERAGREVIPSSIIERAPSAELAPDQLDEHSLPRYTRSSIRCSRPTSSSIARARSSSRRASTPTSSPRRVDGRPRGVQAPSGAAGREAAPKGVRPRPPDADHETSGGGGRPGVDGRGGPARGSSTAPPGGGPRDLRDAARGPPAVLASPPRSRRELRVSSSPRLGRGSTSGWCDRARRSDALGPQDRAESLVEAIPPAHVASQLPASSRRRVGPEARAAAHEAVEENRSRSSRTTPATIAALAAPAGRAAQEPAQPLVPRHGSVGRRGRRQHEQQRVAEAALLETELGRSRYVPS